MLDGLKPYPEMKEAGVLGVGVVPSGWEVQRAKHYFREVDDRSVHGSEEMLSVSHKTGVTPRREKNVTMFMAESNVGHKVCRPDDVVVNTMWAWMAALGVAKTSGLVSPAYGVYRPRVLGRFLPAFLDALLRTPAYTAEYVVRSTGITDSRLRLYPDQFLRIPVLAPAMGEQALIVRFIGHADRRIKRLIAAKLRMIKLLEEQKRAIIDYTVLGGPDLWAPRSPSIARELATVPEGWAVQRLKTLVSWVTSGSRGWSNYAADTGPLFVRIGNLTRASIELDIADPVRLNLPAAAAAEAERTRLRAGDILLSITAYIGSVAVVPDDIPEAYISQHVACCRPRIGAVNSRWVAYVLLSSVGQNHGQIAMNGGTKQGLSLDDVKNYPIFIPPPAEQNRLVERIESSCREIDGAVGRERRQISLLREYRTRLISDVVTGQLDVRDAAARLPIDGDEAPDIEDPDDTSEIDESELEPDAAES